MDFDSVKKCLNNIEFNNSLQINGGFCNLLLISLNTGIILVLKIDLINFFMLLKLRLRLFLLLPTSS